jgi:hypothetical protein
MVRLIPSLLSLLLCACPRVAAGQSFLVQGSAGPTIIDAGYSFAAGAGVSPTPRLTFLVDLERTHLSTRLSTDGRRGVASFRGGVLTLAAAELRVSLFGGDRVGPYGVAGFAAGQSLPKVNEMFQDRVTNDVRALIFGGGIHVPMKKRLSLFADARMMIGAEAGELLAVAPVRGGVAWRF